MSKLSKFKHNGKRLLALGCIPVIAITLTSCSSNVLEAPNPTSDYMSIGNYHVTNNELWDNLKWKAADLFSEYKEEVVLEDKLNDIKAVLSDKNDPNYNSYVKSLQNYIIEDVYDFSFSLDDHEDEIEDLLPATKKQDELEYADTTYVNYDLKGKISREDISNALANANYDALEPLYFIYYHDLASQLLALDKLNEEIKDKDDEDANDDDDDTIGYFSKSEIVTKFEDEYYNQGDADIIMIKFASEDEMNNTLRAFGIYVDDDKYYYLTDTPESYNEYVNYYDDFDFDEASTDEYFDLDASYGHSIILQLYIAMYNYIYPYRNPIYNMKDSSSEFTNSNTIDQRSVTKKIIDFYQQENLVNNADTDDTRINEIVAAAKSKAPEDEPNYISYTADELYDIDTSIYTYVYETLQTPDDNKYKDNTDSRYSTPSTSYSNGNYRYMIFKIGQDYTHVDMIDTTDPDKSYNPDLATDVKYQFICDYSENQEKNQAEYPLIDGKTLLENIKDDLRDEDLTETYISNNLTDCLAEVKVKIYDQAVEISYSVNNSDYTKTLSGAPDKNTLATFTYEDKTLNANIHNDEGTGLFDILEYRSGLTEAANILANKMMKDRDEYKNIPQDVIDNFYQTIEYVLAAFANDALASSGYPASIGKYNFLMLYYHTADLDEIVNDVFKISYVSQDILTNYSSDEVVSFFETFSTKAYNNYFNITAQKLSVYRDTDEDNEPDDVNVWKNEKISKDPNATDAPTYGEKALELIKLVYNLLSVSTDDHKSALTTIVDNYNSSSRYNPHEGGQFDVDLDNDNYYNPMGDEWDFSEYKKLGFVLSTEEVTVTNSTTDVDNTIKDALYNIYKSDGFKLNDNYPSSYLPEVSDTPIISDDSYNYFVITASSGPTSAKFESKDDEYGLYSNLYYMYNESLVKVDNVYNNTDILNNNQIKAYLLEYTKSQTSNLLPSAISNSISNYLSPVLTRFQDNGTQYEIIINYICHGDTSKLTFASDELKDRLDMTLEINKDAADSYIDYGQNAEVYDNFYSWWDSLTTLLSGGND